MRNLFLVFFLELCLVHNACADVGLYKIGDADVFPFQLVVDAGLTANKFSDDKDIQLTFISNYSQQIEEFLLFGSSPDDYESLKNGCKPDKEENSSAFYCGRLAAIDALMRNPGSVNLESFGYVKSKLRGKVVKLDIQFSYALLTKDKKVVGIINHQKLPLIGGKTIELYGWLSPDGDYGARGGKKIHQRILLD